MENIVNHSYYARYLEQKRSEKMYENFQYEVEKMKAREMIRNEAKMQFICAKAEFQQKKAEYEKAVYETIAVNSDGSIAITTQNLWVEAKPRYITNMKFPQMFIAARASDFNERVLILNCEVAGRDQIVYLNPERIASGTYVLGKLTAVGIDIFAPQGKTKEYARKLIAVLVQEGKPAFLPDEPGWMETENGKFTFIEEEGSTWQKIKKLI